MDPPDGIESANIEIAVVGNFYIKMAALRNNLFANNGLVLRSQGQCSQRHQRGAAYEQGIGISRVEGQTGGSNWLMLDIHGINIPLWLICDAAYIRPPIVA